MTAFGGDPGDDDIELTMPRHISPVPFIDDEEYVVSDKHLDQLNCPQR